MGEQIRANRGTEADQAEFRRRLRGDLRALRRLVAERRFDGGRRRVGLELELNLADAAGGPRMVNDAVLDRIASEDFQTELGRFNIEVNVAPRELTGPVFSELARQLRTSLCYADLKAGEVAARIVMIGILPTLMPSHMTRENLSGNERYRMLNERIVSSRGEDFHLVIDGVERLEATAGTILPEACCTSVQLHLQVAVERFAAVWNAAQAIAGPQVAVGANSPFLFGRHLWQETRTILMEQSVDSRTAAVARQGARPRVWFGERWIDEPLELFEENLRYFGVLLPVRGGEDPEAVLASGGVPRLPQLRLHNGTVYRWNRPVYDVARGRPHLRVENRVLAAGPSVTDVVANAAFFYGLVRALADSPDPVWRRLPFAAARSNFHAGARDGLAARMVWPGFEEPVPVRELVLGELLPLAARGLDAWRVDPGERDRCLGMIEARVRSGRTGAWWQAELTRHLCERRGHTRMAALAAMTLRYADLARGGEAVHDWPVD